MQCTVNLALLGLSTVWPFKTRLFSFFGNLSIDDIELKLSKK